MTIPTTEIIVGSFAPVVESETPQLEPLERPQPFRSKWVTSDGLALNELLALEAGGDDLQTLCEMG